MPSGNRKFIPLPALAIAAVVSIFPVDVSAAATVRVVGPGQGVPEGPISSLLVSENRLYVGTRGKGLFLHELEGGQTRRVTRSDGLPSDDVTSLAKFRGKIYVGTSDGIGVAEGSAWSVLREVVNVRMNNVFLSATPDGRELWAGAVSLAGGTARFDGTAWHFIGGEGRGLFNNVNSFAFHPGGVILGGQSGAVYLRKGDDIEPLGPGFPQANVFGVAERGGTIYAGTSMGLFLWRGSRWEKAIVPEPAAGGAVYAFVRSGTDLFVGGSKGLLLLDRNGNSRFLSGERGFPAGAVTALAEDGGTIYAGTGKGVAVLRGWSE